MPSLNFEDEKKDFRDFYDSNRENLHAALRSIEILVDSLIRSDLSIAISSTEGRIKNREECISKFTRKYRTKLEESKTPYTIRDSITDLIGVRVVCLYEDDVEKIKDIVKSHFDVIDITDKISQIERTEDSFGYKGLHLDLKLNSSRRAMLEYGVCKEFSFELQIRTVVQDSWSIIDHKIKYKKSIPNGLKRRINTLAALFELADREFKAIRDATSAELKSAGEQFQIIEAETEAVEKEVNLNGNQNQNDAPRNFALLNAFNFQRIAQHFFPGFHFESHKVDGFTQEITSLNPELSRGKFNFYMRENVTFVKQYKAEFEKSDEKMNPYTIIRHCLYKGDRECFKSMLTDVARERFDKYIVQKENPNSV